MKFFVQNRKNLLLATLVAASFGLNAQIESTHTDVKYGYTTVVYKDKAATDTDVLHALENSVGMGDVVRVTVAPPKPAAAPKIDNSKGEDTWLKPVSKPSMGAMTAAASTAAAANLAMSPAAPKAYNAPLVAANTAPATPKPVVNKAVAAPKPVVVTPAAKNVVAVVDAPLAEQINVAAPKTVRVARSAASIKAAKSTNKSLKKGKSKHKPKHRKKGKQRYKCPKF